MVNDQGIPNADIDGISPVPAPPRSSGHSGPAYPGYPTDTADSLLDEIHLRDYLKVVYKRRWIAIATFLIIFVTAVFYSYTTTPIYSARAQLLIETENPNFVNFEQVMKERTTTDYYQTQYRLLQSRALARKVLDVNNLWTDRRFGGGAVPAAKSRFEWVGRLFGQQQPVESAAPDETGAQSRAIDALLGGLIIAPIRNSRLVDVRYESSDPNLAAQLANGFARAYIEQSLELKFSTSKDASEFLGARLGEQRKQVEAGEEALQKYRESNDAVSLEERQNIVVQKLGELNTAVTNAKTTRLQKEAAYNQIRKAQTTDRNTLDAIPAILGNIYIQNQKSVLADLQRQQTQLAEKLGERHPDMVRIRLAIQAAEAKLDTEIGKVVEAVRNEYVAAQTQETSLMQALTAQTAEAQDLNRKAIDYGVLQRDAVVNRQIFDSLIQRTKETDISGELKTSNVRIVDPAERPRAPNRPNHSLDVTAGFGGGLLLALGLVFFFEYIDNRIKMPEEIQKHLGLPFLGILPAIPPAATQRGGTLPHNFSEALRVVRTNLLFASADAGSRSLVVTSTGPGEGKTMVASSLARALAASGMRVALIDADLRRPRVHEEFDLAHEPGLSNVLVGSVKASEALHKIADSTLCVLTAGHTPPNPAELLGSARFLEFTKTLGRHFDWVIIDSPPALAVTDAAVISHSVSGVLFVIGTEMTSRQAARVAVQQLTNAHATFAGAVLNRVDLHRHAYYYSSYYNSKYQNYYVAENKGTTV